MPTQPPAGSESAAFLRLAKALSRDPRVDPPALAKAKGFGSKGLKVARKLFAFESKQRLVLKLPKARVDELVAEGIGLYFDPGHGRLMKQWIALGAEQQARWSGLAKEALELAATGVRRP